MNEPIADRWMQSPSAPFAENGTMTPRLIRLLLFFSMVGSLSSDCALGQTGDDSGSTATQNRVERLLQAFAAGEELPDDAVDRISDLIVLVESGEANESEIAIRVLATMDSKASPAIASISKKLGDSAHALRAAAADALVAIGDQSAASARGLMTASNARTRASAAHVLARLKRLDLSDLAQLAEDSDPRVRSVAANALSALSKPGVPLLATLLEDPDLAVAAEAARALAVNRDDEGIAVPSLMKALARADFGGVSVDALSTYGVGAKRAIPAIVKVHSLRQGDWQFRQAAEAALEHIGPPDANDIAELCESLRGDEETRIMAAKSLGLLGLDGKLAADALEAAAESSFKEFERISRDSKTKQDERPNNSGRVFLSGEDCIVAVWDVTHDSDRYLRLIERLAIAADSPIFDYYSHRAVMSVLTAEDYRFLKGMLQHANINVQETALALLSDVGEKAEPLKRLVLELARGTNAELSHKAIHTLVAMGTDAGNDAAPILVAKLQDGSMPLKDFADAVGRLEIRTPAAQSILERGLNDKDQWTAVSCANTLCITSNEPRRVARLVIEAARAGHFTDRNAIECLTRLKTADDVVLPFLVRQLENTDYWTRHDAIDSLAAFGPKAAQAIPKLKMQLSDKTPLIRLKSAAAILLIANDAAELDRQLEVIYAGDDQADRYQAIATIAELKRFGARFVRYPLAELHRSPPAFAEKAIDALQAIGTEEAAAGLRMTAESSDWALRSQAAKALRQLEVPAEKGRN